MAIGGGPLQRLAGGSRLAMALARQPACDGSCAAAGLRWLLRGSPTRGGQAGPGTEATHPPTAPGGSRTWLLQVAAPAPTDRVGKHRTTGSYR